MIPFENASPLGLAAPTDDPSDPPLPKVVTGPVLDQRTEAPIGAGTLVGTEVYWRDAATIRHGATLEGELVLTFLSPDTSTSSTGPERDIEDLLAGAVRVVSPRP